MRTLFRSANSYNNFNNLMARNALGFTADPGEFIVPLGPATGGKSLTLRVIGGIFPAGLHGILASG